MEIREITQSSHDLSQLCTLLIDAVDSGASIGFLAPLSLERAKKYWVNVLSSLSRDFILLGAFEGESLVGSVQLECSGKENGAHRAEVQKLFVLCSHRGKGIAKKLMFRTEEFAKSLNRTLLVLDTKQGDNAEFLYPKIGYQRAGIIPKFAINSDGGFGATVFFYKEI
jgi:acetyltransferase